MTESLVLLHGFLGCPADWDLVRARWPDLTTVALEIVGHRGKEDSNLPTSFDAEVDRLGLELAAQKLQNVHLVGYSLGARLALGLLLRQPARIARATLIGVHPGLIDPRERAERTAADEAWAHRLDREGLDSFLDAWEAQPLFASQARLPVAVREHQRCQRRRHQPRGLATALRKLSLGQMPARWAALAKIEVPIALVHGADDLKFAALAERAAAAIPRGRRISIAGAGHNPVLERPEALAKALAGPTQGEG